MAKIAVVIVRNFEDDELRALAHGLRDEGHELVMVGPGQGREVRGRRNRETVQVEVSTQQADIHAFDGLVIPSGYRPDDLMRHESLLNLVRDVYASGKPVGTLSAAGWLLVGADADLSWPTIKRDLLNVGADWREKDVVTDRNVRFSKSPGDIDGFVKAFGRALEGSLAEQDAPAWERAPSTAPVEPSHAVD
jgi:protease I